MTLYSAILFYEFCNECGICHENNCNVKNICYNCFVVCKVCSGIVCIDCEKDNQSTEICCDYAKGMTYVDDIMHKK